MQNIALWALALAMTVGAAPEKAPSASETAALERTLHPTVTPNRYGLKSQMKTADIAVDQQGNRIVIRTPEPGSKDKNAYVPPAYVTPTADYRPHWNQLRDFEERLGSAERSGLITRVRAKTLKDRLSLLKIKYGVNRRPDGAGLSEGQLKKLGQEIDVLKKDLFD